MDLEKIIQKINKIKGQKEKIKFIEKLLAKNQKDKKLKKELLKILKTTKTEQKKKEKSKKTLKHVPLEDLLFKRMETFAETEIQIKDYFTELVPQISSIPFKPLNEITKSDDYLHIDAYQTKEQKNDYIKQQFEFKPAYERASTAETFLMDSQLIAERAMGAIDTRQFGASTEFEFSSNTYNDIGEYKRRELITKAIEDKEREKQEYKRKISMGWL